MSFSLSETPIEVESFSRELHEAGAVLVFEGRVRNRNEGRPVRSLEYSSYPELADKEGNRIIAEALAKFPVLAIHAVHRVGHLQLGDLAIWVGVAAGHRGEAFDACRWVVDEIKARVPIWKKEHYLEGPSGWVGLP